MAISNPVTAVKKYFSKQVDSFYINALCPEGNRLAWFMRDMMRATPDRKKWNRFFVDTDFDLLRHAGSDIGILSENSNAVMLFDQNYIQFLKVTHPEKFLDLSNQVLQVAYMAAYFYPASKNTVEMMNHSLSLIQSKKGILNHFYEFHYYHKGYDANGYETNEFDHDTLIFKRKDQQDILISKFRVRSIYNHKFVTIFVGYDNDNLYYSFQEKEDFIVFSISPLSVENIMKEFKVVTKDELFKNVTLDLIGFMTGSKPDTIPTQREKLLIDMTNI